jgi:hypothetical protein
MMLFLRLSIIKFSCTIKNTADKINKTKKVAYTILVEDGKTDSARWVDIRVEEARRELALGWLAWVVLAEMQCQRVKSPFPFCLHKTSITMIHLLHF